LFNLSIADRYKVLGGHTKVASISSPTMSSDGSTEVNLAKGFLPAACACPCMAVMLRQAHSGKRLIFRGGDPEVRNSTSRFRFPKTVCGCVAGSTIGDEAEIGFEAPGTTEVACVSSSALFNAVGSEAEPEASHAREVACTCSWGLVVGSVDPAGVLAIPSLTGWNPVLVNIPRKRLWSSCNGSNRAVVAIAVP
jgi:hypothetical protein